MVLPELASIRIAVYEESGKFIGHRVLPVVGLCPGYRHVNLRTDLGQPLPMATLFLHVVVKDYVPDGLSDFAEALTNPIKYQSDLEKRAQQLAVLTDDMEPTCSGEDNVRKYNDVKAENESPLPKLSPNSKVSHADHHSVQENDKPVTVGISSSMLETNQVIKVTEPKEEKVEELMAEPLEKILENKLVKEKKLELDKKLETLRKKHEKKKMTLQSQKSGDLGGGEKKSFINMKLVKRISSKNM